jgi:hypothetical protein
MLAPRSDPTEINGLRGEESNRGKFPGRSPYDAITGVPPERQPVDFAKSHNCEMEMLQLLAREFAPVT